MWVPPVPSSCGIGLGMDSLRSALRWARGLSAGLWAAHSPLRTPGFPPGAGIAALGAGWVVVTPKRAAHFPLLHDGACLTVLWAKCGVTAVGD